MSLLLLIKHAHPDIDTTLPPGKWPLAERGRRDAEEFAERLRPFLPFDLVTSTETKAHGTGETIANTLGLSFEARPGLHEHDREGVPFYTDRAAFEAHVRAFFNTPDACLFGNESATESCDRFTRAVDDALATVTGNLAIVCHGTVISLFAAARAKVDAFDLWKRQTLPACVVLDTSDWRIQQILTTES